MTSEIIEVCVLVIHMQTSSWTTMFKTLVYFYICNFENAFSKAIKAGRCSAFDIFIQ